MIQEIATFVLHVVIRPVPDRRVTRIAVPIGAVNLVPDVLWDFPSVPLLFLASSLLLCLLSSIIIE